MAAISGKNGMVKIGSTKIAHITNWTLNTTSNNPSFASSSTGGYKARVAGVKDASGTFAFKLDKEEPITDDLEEGATVTLLLYIDDTDFYTVPAIIDALRFEVDIDNGEPVGGTADFSANGQWTKPTYSS